MKSNTERLRLLYFLMTVLLKKSFFYEFFYDLYMSSSPGHLSRSYVTCFSVIVFCS